MFNKTISGFCPTLNKNYSIEVFYEIIQSYGHPPKFVQVGADCEYASYVKCPNREKCPLRVKAPKQVSGV